MRTQIYLTERQRNELAAIAKSRGQRQSEVIREAVDRFIEQWSAHGRQRILCETAGLWSGRSDVPDYETIWAAWERGWAVESNDE